MDGIACSFGKRLDVNAPTRQFRGETGILSIASDRKTELILIDHHGRGTIAFRFRKINATYSRRANRFGNINNGVLIPLNNVNFFVVQFLDNRLNTDALDSYTCANRINTRLGSHDGNFGAGTRLACNCTDLNDTMINFRDLVLKQASQEIAMRT